MAEELFNFLLFNQHEHENGGGNDSSDDEDNESVVTIEDDMRIEVTNIEAVAGNNAKDESDHGGPYIEFNDLAGPSP